MAQEQEDFYPKLEPYKTGFLKVSDLHEIYYQCGGNPEGKPVLYLHGGPGAGCMDDDFRYFNPEKFNIILHDQRGSGKSKPWGEIKENTTKNLIEDVEKLRKHLNLDKVIIFGGSWGSTLALAYAEAYPQNVSGIIMRGIFTATREEIEHYYLGGVGRYFPETYQEFLSYIPDPKNKNYAAQIVEKLQSPDKEIRDKYAKAWAMYEGKIAFLNISDEVLSGFFKYWNPWGFSVIENYYMANNCFLQEGQLLANADKLKDIPMIIVNGRYDVICPPITAYTLHKKLPKSKLVIVESAGHSASEPGIKKALIETMHSFE
ncbi:MAG: prolyl aminopeptidase [Candidatus Fischerbacteria bacterium RBG_13_37_8]|uniref:Proline iminopeptidase n=1 Tax=Candidatus Fischerbacteria bacterium RBG_13_37_8 TaxID=1817863 RepID=A0A1F5V996_9BACT|nr:MAG: prolyl aminopeptidase [Candidatus Fischerbacteria bacterium RBG_13_37_8]